jgi:hypothetical protein
VLPSALAAGASGTLVAAMAARAAEANDAVLGNETGTLFDIVAGIDK